MKHLICLIAVLVMIQLIPCNGIANEHHVTAQFGAITVYRDRALVTRDARVELTPGEHRLLFEPLPAGLAEQSVRVRGEGTARVTILGVEIQQAYPAEHIQARVRELENEIRQLRYESDIVQSVLTSLDAERDLLKSIRVHTGEQMGKEFAVQQPDTRQWESTIEYLRSKLEANLQSTLEKQQAQEELKKQIDRLQRELQQITSGQQRDAKRVTVRVRAEQHGYLDLGLSYLTGRARWQPVYEARVSDRNDDVHLSYNATVMQQTGEDWEDARIILSTAQPATRARMPVLNPWYLLDQPPPPPVTRRDLELQEVDTFFKVEGMAAPAAAVAEEQITSMIFRVPGSHTIPSDGSGHRVYIDDYTLTGPKEYIATPKLNPNAFLQVKTTNTSDVVFLPGTMNIFLGNDFVGSSSIGYTAQDEPVELSLGIDEGIRISRTEVSRKVDEGGFLSKRKKTDFAYIIEVENYKQHPVTISIFDHLPVSQHTDIEVGVNTMQPSPVERTEQGIMTWNLELQPGEKKEIAYGFYVRHPLDMDVSGI